MMMPLDLHLDLSLHSTCHEEQEEFDAIVAILAEEEGLTIEELLALLQKEKANLPDMVVDFVEARLGTFRRNMDFAHEQAESLLDALEEDDVGDVLGGFVRARVKTFSKNLVAISSIANKQSSKRLDTFRGNMNTLSSLLAPRPYRRQAKRLAE